MNKLSEIFQAWVAAANPTPAQKLLAEQRTAVCDSCPNKKQLDVLNIYVCGLCGCPLEKLVFSPKGKEACKGNKWEK